MSIAIISGIILLLAGLCGVSIIILRKIPILLKLSPKLEPAPDLNLKESMKNRLNELKYFSYRPVMLNSLEKMLRKFRLWILKVDNLFLGWINKSRNKADTWTIRSKAWMEHRRVKTREKAIVLEQLDKVEVSKEIEKITKEVAKEEDQALLEKIETVNAETDKVEEEEDMEGSEPEMPVSAEEKKYIDMIAENPKDREAYRALGFIYLRQKNYSDARASFRQVLKLDPADEEIQNRLNEIKGLRSKKPKITVQL